MSWKALRVFRDKTVPKLNNLRRAAAAGLRVPPTWWVEAASAGQAAAPPPELRTLPLIIRSGSPTEDQRTTSNAGQLLSLVVRERSEFPESLARVVAALPRDGRGQARGAVFVQPLVQAEEAGVAFFDGFYFERALAASGNEALTSGQARGQVSRGHLQRGDTWSAWLSRIYAVFGGRGGDQRLDIEFTRDKEGLVLLQVRPALFPVRRNETLTLANHREVLGELPSPWIVSALVQAGRNLEFLEAVEPALRDWDEGYAVEVVGRAWLNMSLWYRGFDHFGLPRTFATRSIGGDLGGPEDRRLLWGPFLRRFPRAVRAAWLCWRKGREAEAGLRDLDKQLRRAKCLADLHQATVAGLVLALHINFAVAGLWTLMVRLRAALHLPTAARPVTQEMMEEYSRLAALPNPGARAAGLDGWLARFGHRGPVESDLARPRFAELRTVLLQDLEAAAGAASPSAVAPPGPGFLARLTRPLSWLDERREWFRDALMRRWQRLRALMLQEGARLVAAGQLDQPEDVFWLHGEEIKKVSNSVVQRPLREAVTAARARADQFRTLDLPTTASRDQIEALVSCSGVEQARDEGRQVFPGIALGPAVIEGPALKADDLTTLLAEAGQGSGLLTSAAILVVPALEPSWAVVFPRVAGVVAEVGGELSHASILLREARKPAVVNCAGIFRQVRTGDHLRLDGARALVEIDVSTR
jgi:pyruvate,water dikinase